MTRVNMGTEYIQGYTRYTERLGYTWVYRVYRIYMGVQGIHEYGHSITII